MRQEEEKNEKLSGAMRIFEALASVDEELLERSEGKGKIIPFGKYAKLIGAAACFLVLGVTVAVGSSMFTVKENSSDCAVQEEQIAPEEADCAAEITVEEESMLEEGIVDEGMETDMEEVTQSLSGQTQEELKDEIKENTNVENDTVWDVGSLESADRDMDLEELRMVDKLGAYIPTDIPEAYVFESGTQSAEESGENDISLLWMHGMDTIRITIREYGMDAQNEAENENRIVDVAEVETYNVHLYEIPYCDSVPDEYYMVFYYPIFREVDFSLEVVKARMKSVGDQGDTDTPRGNFAVLYDSGILIEFSGDGDAESIWEMFESVNP